VSALAESLLLAQLELPTALERNAEGYGYRYTTLDALLAAVRPVLNKHGLTVEQAICFTALPDGPPIPTLVTRFRHAESGETDGDTMLLPPLDGNMQHYGSAITYARRYALAAALGIASEEDDDASQGHRSDSQPLASRKAPPEPPQPSQAGEGEPWRWPFGKLKGQTLSETPFTYLEWYCENGKMADVVAMCAQEISARKAQADPLEEEIPF
jgi:hypothetical protein